MSSVDYSKRISVYGMYFSGTGTTRKIVSTIAQALAENFRKTGSQLRSEDAEIIDFTPPGAREKKYGFHKGDVVVFGVPVIAGRVPNVLLPFLDTIEGGDAIAVPVVLYGNRNFDDALIELRNILEDRGFHTVAAAAFIGEHSFSRKLAAGRPDEADLDMAKDFAVDVAEKIMGLIEAGSGDAGSDAGAGVQSDIDYSISDLKPVRVEGQEPLRPYYKPRDRQGNHINILKVKPKLDASKCNGCGICVEVCPMGSIRADAPGIVDGICIKCCGCEKKCPEGALYFDDPGYLYHKEELELGYPDRKDPKVFL